MLSPRRTRSVLIGAFVLACVAAAGYVGVKWNARRADRAEAIDLVRQKKLTEAEPGLERAFARDRDDFEVVVALAKVHTTGARLVADAEPYLTRWCELRPNDPEPFHHRFDMWLLLKRFDRALDDADRLAKLEPNDRDMARMRATLLARVGRYAEADIESTRLLANDPTNEALMLLRAEILIDSGDSASAVKLLDTLTARNPPVPRALLLRGTIFALAEPPDHERAIPLLKKAIDLAQPNERTTARYHLARMLSKAGREADARATFEALERDRLADRHGEDARQQPGNLSAHVRAATACFAAGRPADGVDWLNRALARDPTNRPAHLALAEYHAGRGERTLADEHRRLAGE